MLGLWEHPSERIHTQHFAFEVGAQDLPAMMAELAQHVPGPLRGL